MERAPESRAGRRTRGVQCRWVGAKRLLLTVSGHRLPQSVLLPSGKPDGTSAPARGRPEAAATAPCAVISAASRPVPSRLRTGGAALSRSVPCRAEQLASRSAGAELRCPETRTGHLEARCGHGPARHASIRPGINHKGQRVKLIVIRMRSELLDERAARRQTPNSVK